MKPIRDDIAEIKTQFIALNGTVRDLVIWRWFVSGGFATLATLVLVFGIFIYQQAGTDAATDVDWDCSDFKTRTEAQRFLLPGDPYGLDPDGDLFACEELAG